MILTDVHVHTLHEIYIEFTCISDYFFLVYSDFPSGDYLDFRFHQYIGDIEIPL